MAVEVELERLRDTALQKDGGCTVLKCVQLCALHGLVMPDWLGERYVQLFALVSDAHVRTWDEAFGSRWPPGTRLDMVRRRQKLLPRVHAAVWAELEADPSRAIDISLFESAGQRVGYSGGQTRFHYYRALEQGFMNLQIWKRDEVRRRRSIPDCGR